MHLNHKRKLTVKNINPKLREYDVRIKPTAHVSPPAIAVKRHVIALQRTDANGPRRKVNAIARDPIQTGRQKKKQEKRFDIAMIVPS